MTIPRSIARVQQVAQSIMSSTATVYHKTVVSDSAGGQTETFVLAFTSKCYFSRSVVTPIERENAVTVQALVLWEFAFPADTAIVPTDRIVVGSRTFEVVTGASGTIEILTRVTCREII